MEPLSSRLGNALAAWVVLAGIVLAFAGLCAIHDERPAVAPDPLPPTHWTVRLYATFTADDPDETEPGHDRPAPAWLDRVAGSEIAELLN